MKAGQEIDRAYLDTLPAAPGVYLMKNADGRIIYIGKAANLRNRVRSYFTSSGDSRFSVAYLRRDVADIQVIVTANESEALLLENSLIKQHKPRYNIQLRDDKTYVSLRIRMDHRFPRIEIVRVRPRAASTAPSGKDLYFGPYVSAGAVREVLRFLLKVFPLRSCKDNIFSNRTRPCILHDVGKCCAPCVLPVRDEDYRALIGRVATFLRGRDDEVRRLLAERMQEFSGRMEFEKAALVRDRIAAMDLTLEKQGVAGHSSPDRDVIAVTSAQGRSLVVLHEYRFGLLSRSVEYYTRNYEQEDAAVLYAAICQHYGAAPPSVDEVLVSTAPHDAPLLEQWLAGLRGRAVTVAIPQRGGRAALAEAALRNSREILAQRLAGEHSSNEALQELAMMLDLPGHPETIECVDISNIMGVMAVGSIVRFAHGEPDKAGYRMFRIRTVEGANDYAMMREVLSRRFEPGKAASLPPPDLLLVDGGKGQLRIAARVLAELGVPGTALASIAKPGGTRTQTDAGSAHTAERARDRIFLPQRRNPAPFARNSPGLFLLARVRDEAHRFAITYHKKLRSMANRRSLLDEVPGVGPVRKRQLLRHFGSLAALRRAGVDEIAALPGMSRETAMEIQRFLARDSQQTG